MRRNGKRALALLLTLVMALGLTVPALAAEEVFEAETPAGLAEDAPAAPIGPEAEPAPDVPEAASAEPVDAPAAELTKVVYEVGNTDELREALTNTEEETDRTVRLKNDIDLTKPIVILEQHSPLLLDLNGWTITKAGIADGTAAITLRNVGSITMQGGTITGPGTLLQTDNSISSLHLEGITVDSGGDGSCAAVCANDGTVSVEDGAVIEAAGTAISDVDAYVNILGGSVISHDECAIVVRSNDKSGKVSVKGGTIESETSAGVCLLSGGPLTVGDFFAGGTDAVIIGKAGIVVLGGTAAIIYGTVTANGTDSVQVGDVSVPPAAVVADNMGVAGLSDGVFSAAAGQEAVVYTMGGLPANDQNVTNGSRLQVFGGVYSSAVDINLLDSDFNTELVSGGMYSYYTSLLKAEQDRKDGDTVRVLRPEKADLVAVGFLPEADDAMLTELAEKVGAGAVTGSGDNTFYIAFKAAAAADQTYTVTVQKRHAHPKRAVFTKEFEAGTVGGLVFFAQGDEGVDDMDDIQGLYAVNLAEGEKTIVRSIFIEVHQVTYVPGGGAQGEAVTVYTDVAGLEAALAAGRPAGITLSGGSNTWDEPVAEEAGSYAWTVTFPAHYEYHGGLIIPDTTPSPSPSASPEPPQTPSPDPTPTPGPGVTPSPVPVPVDPPKTNGGSGWSYDYDTGDYYYFVDGEPKANYWANEADASQWGFWYYVGADGKLATGLQYIENNNGTGWYFLQPDNADGCIGRMLTGWQWLGPDIGMGWFNTAHGGVNGQCTWTENWGDYNPATGLWEDGLSHK